MALEATHLRFALSLKDRYGVRDMENFLAGAIYPDSRCLSKIDRQLTHPNGYADWNLEEVDDFKKGWLTHLIADEIQYRAIEEMFPEIFTDEDILGSETWIRHTAIKIIQDIDDAKRFDIRSCLPRPESASNPHEEDIVKVKKFNQICAEFYSDPDLISPSCYQAKCLKLGIDGQLTDRLIAQTEKYLAEKDIVAAIGGLYQKMLDNINKDNI